MTIARFWVNRVELRNEPEFCVLVGQVRSGTIVPGMHVAVKLNSQTIVTVRVTNVMAGGEPDETALSLECESTEEAEILAALNLAEEELEVAD